MTPLKEAMRLAELGYRVFPCIPSQKKPATMHGCRDATCDPETIERWWTTWPSANLAVSTDGLLVVDVDPLPDGSANPWLADPERLDALACGPMATTPRGGRHFWFRQPEGSKLRCTTSVIAVNVDTRANGGYIIVAPSRTDRGAYRWCDGYPLDCGPDDLALPPAWLLDALTRRPQRNGQAKPVGDGETIPEGQRNSTLASIAGAMRHKGCSVTEILAALRETNARRCSPALDDAEVSRIALSVERYEPAGDKRPEPRGSTAWSEPQALPSAIPSVEPFNPELLPERFRPWIVDIAERIQCPIDFPAVGAMVALAGVVGRQVAIRPKRYDDWTVVANLWGALIGRPSVMKTPALQETLKPLVRLEAEARERFEEENRRHLTTEIVREARGKLDRKKVEAAVKNGGDAENIAAKIVDDESENAPVRQRYITDSATVEKLGELLANNPRGITVRRDELVGHLRELDREGQESARAFYLTAWDGNSRFTYDRIGRGTVEIEAACVSIIGGIQPGPLSEYLCAARNHGAGDDGLIQRFQLAIFPDLKGEWRNVDRWPDTVAKNAAYEVFTRLDGLDAAAIGAETDADSPENPPYLRFTPDAQVIFNQWREKLQHRLRFEGMPPILEAHLTKYNSLIPSLALLIHLADDGSGPVLATVLSKAVGWGRYLESHARRIFAVAADPGLASATALAEKILSGALTDGFTLRSVYRHGWTALANRDEAEAAVDYLTDSEWLRPETEKTGGAPKIRYRVNPRISESPPDTTDKPDKSHFGQGEAATSVSSVSAVPGDVPEIRPTETYPNDDLQLLEFADRLASEPAEVTAGNESWPY
ncbi:MAG: DUF3987 domain-containing protein [Planctomycetaceae bacterium]|nr:DUF3987 domain-containing protein [Planctomycetaceae bacterium]